MSERGSRATAHRRRRCAVATLFVVTTTGGGCYRYHALPDARPAPGESVRLALTGAGQAQLSPVVGDGVVAVEGDVVAAAPGHLTVRIARLLTAARVSIAWSGEPVEVPTGAVASVERRQLSRGRTAMLFGGVALGVALLAATIGSAASDGGGPDPGPIQP